jgi:hypothetical protein
MDKTAKVWDQRTFSSLATIMGHNDEVGKSNKSIKIPSSSPSSLKKTALFEPQLSLEDSARLLFNQTIQFSLL